MNSKRSTFIQKYSSSFFQRRLDYILISKTLQEFVTMTEILTPISTDHSPVLFSFSKKVLLEVKDFGNLIVPQLKTKFHFVILVASRLVNIIGCMNFLSSFLDVITMSMPIVSFLLQLDSEIICLQSAFLWPMNMI